MSSAGAAIPATAIALAFSAGLRAWHKP